MYKGKFSNNQSGRSTQELLQERSAQDQALRERQAQARNSARPAPQRRQPVNPTHSPAGTPVPGRAPAPRAQQPMQQAPGASRNRPPQQERPTSPRTAADTPRQQPAPVPQVPAEPKKHRVFSLWYFGFILVFALVTFLGLRWLEGWLTDYEAAQPGKTAEAYFQAYFANPDWGLLYDNSITKGTDLEGKDAYVAHMKEKVGASQLTYQETSAGLSGDKKYYVKLGDEKIASFMLLGDAEHITDIPNWELGDI